MVTPCQPRLACSSTAQTRVRARPRRAPADHLGPATYLDEDPLEGGVTDVVDGDTIQVASRGVETTVRLVGIGVG
jgi:endonuclease YncB( thermonuclease family)